jgi:lysozyme
MADVAPIKLDENKPDGSATKAAEQAGKSLADEALAKPPEPKSAPAVQPTEAGAATSPAEAGTANTKPADAGTTPAKPADGGTPAPKPGGEKLPAVDIENNPSGDTAPQTRKERKAVETKYFQYEFQKKNIVLDPFQKEEGPYQVLDRMNKEHKLSKAVPFIGERQETWSDEQILDAARRISHRDLHGEKQVYKVGEEPPLWSDKDIKARVKELVNLPRGVDVSRYDGNIDWQKVKAGGIDFAFIKATGAKRSGEIAVDPTYENNRNGAAAAGVRTGFYHFFRPDVPVDQQVQLFASTVGKVGRNSLPLVIDVEEDDKKPMWKTSPDGHEYTSRERVQIIHDFCNGLKKALGPHTPIAIYTSAPFVRNNLDYDRSLAKYPLWDANWKVPQPLVPAPWHKPAVWQYVGDIGKVYGIDKPEGGVDLDMAYDPNFLRRNGRQKHR